MNSRQRFADDVGGKTTSTANRYKLVRQKELTVKKLIGLMALSLAMVFATGAAYAADK